MSEHTPQHPKPPAGQYGTGQPPGGDPPPDQPPSGQYPPPPATPYPSGEPGTGQYQPTTPSYPPAQPPADQYPPAQPPTSYPPSGQYPPQQQPPAQPPPSYPPTQPPTGQYPPSQPPTGQYPPSQPPTGQYPPSQPPSLPPTGQYPPAPPPSYPPTYPPAHPPTGQYPQPPATTKCPDPCDKEQPWGPPKIDATCYPTDSCCEPPPKYLAWDEVADDPCARASSAGCSVKSTRLSCECKSTNAECTCEEWDCGGFRDGMCVPCKPCEGLLPEDGGDEPDDGSGEPKPDGCSAEALRQQLEANKRYITSKQTEKARLEAEIKSRQEREKELATLIASFETIVDKYKAERHKLVCREDCLKGFYRDTSKIFDDPARFPENCKQDLQKAINETLCSLELAKCCQKNLEWKLEKPTRLIWQQKEAEKAWKKAEEAFALIKDLPKWMTDQFNELEKLKDQIAQALNDKDPQKHKWALYLFYWKFAPQLCKRFKVAICCKPTETSTPPPAPAPAPGYGPQTGNPTAAGTTTVAPTASTHIGCAPGDWHPSKITEDTLKKLICCASDYVKAEKTKYQKATDAIDTARQHLEFIKKKVEDEGKAVEDRIRTRLDQVATCGAASSR